MIAFSGVDPDMLELDRTSLSPEIVLRASSSGLEMSRCTSRGDAAW